MKKSPKGMRKYIRKEKARIRRELLGIKEQEEEIKKLAEFFSVQPLTGNGKVGTVADKMNG